MIQNIFEKKISTVGATTDCNNMRILGLKDPPSGFHIGSVVSYYRSHFFNPQGLNHPWNFSCYVNACMAIDASRNGRMVVRFGSVNNEVHDGLPPNVRPPICHQGKGRQRRSNLWSNLVRDIFYCLIQKPACESPPIRSDPARAKSFNEFNKARGGRQVERLITCYVEKKTRRAISAFGRGKIGSSIRSRRKTPTLDLTVDKSCILGIQPLLLGFRDRIHKSSHHRRTGRTVLTKKESWR